MPQDSRVGIAFHQIQLLAPLAIQGFGPLRPLPLALHVELSCQVFRQLSLALGFGLGRWPLNPKRYLDRGGLLDELIAPHMLHSPLGCILVFEYFLGYEQGQGTGALHATVDADLSLTPHRRVRKNGEISHGQLCFIPKFL